MAKILSIIKCVISPIMIFGNEYSSKEKLNKKGQIHKANKLANNAIKSQKYKKGL